MKVFLICPVRNATDEQKSEHGKLYSEFRREQIL